MPRVFISHASADRDLLARDIVPLLERHGVETWVSWKDIRTAEDWERSIETALIACDWFLVVVSAAAAGSAWVRREVEWALTHRAGHIVPVLLDPDVDLDAIHSMVRHIQYVDFAVSSDSARAKLLATWSLGYRPPARTAFQRGQHVRDEIAKLHGYSLIRTLTVGPNSQTFLMYSVVRQMPVAVEVFRESLEHEGVVVELTALRRLAQVRHPALVAVYGVGALDDHIHVIYEYIDGETMWDTLRRGNLTVPQKAQLIATICEGLHAAHMAGVLHLDLKPASILIARDGTAYVTNFANRVRVGTPSYLAPELLAAHEADSRADIWSVGVVFYELLTGRRPFGVYPSWRMIDEIMRVQPPNCRDVSPDTPEALEEICLKCLAKRPEDRYASAGTVAEDLRAWLNT